VALARSHTCPHAPQLARVFRLVSHPLVASPSQFAKPALQVPSWQVPEKHTPAAFGKAQMVPQEPQFWALDERSASQPLAALPSQLP
jgi:hypothetical protein